MKCAFALLILATVPVLSAAQQSTTKKSEDINYDCESNQMFYSLCRRMEDRDRDSWQKLKLAEQAAKKAQLAEEAIQDAIKSKSADPHQQIDGIIDSAKKTNSEGNKNGASEKVTDKSLDIIKEFMQQAQERLDEAKKNTENISEAHIEADSSFKPGGHQLSEPASVGQLTTEEEFLNQVEQLNASPSTVATVVKADQRVRAEEEAYRVQRAKEVKEERAQQAAIDNAKHDADVAAAKAADAREEREWRQAMRQRQAAMANLQQAYLQVYQQAYMHSMSYVSYYGATTLPAATSSTDSDRKPSTGPPCLGKVCVAP